MIENKNELVSIIVPVYNVEKYISECIESIINQTYKNLEIILVNDGSTDNSLKICNTYKDKDDRILIIDKRNGGLSDARNYGINIARGKYFCFIDSDDYVDEKYVELLYKAIKENNVDLALCNIVSVNDDKIALEKFTYDNSYIKSGKEILNDYYNGHHVEDIVAWNKMYSRELFNEYRYNVGKIHEDEFLTYKILYNLDKVAIVGIELYNYRKNNASIVNKKFNIKRLDMLEAFEERLEFFKEKNERKLYIETLSEYMGLLRVFYIRTRKNINNSKNIQKNIIKKYKNLRKEILGTKEISLIKKIKYLIFYYFNNIFYLIKILTNKY